MNSGDIHHTRWKSGSVVLVRVVGSANGIVWGHPHVVVRDTGHQILLYQPEGTEILRARLGESSLEMLSSYISQMDVLRVLNMRLRYSVWLVWVGRLGTAPHWLWFEGSGRFRGWKADIHSLPLRTQIGFDFTDDAVDLIVSANGQRFWKDETHLSRLVDAGIYLPDDVAKIQEVCAKAEADAAQKRFPFNASLQDWIPERCWSIPTASRDTMVYGNPWLNLSAGRRFDDISSG